MRDQDMERRFGDPEPARAGEVTERRYTRGATDLIVSLASDGRTVRLFTADGDADAPSYYRSDRIPGTLDTSTDR